MKIENNNQEIEILEDSITVKNKKEENHTLEDLKQKLINDMHELETYGKEDIEILKILFETKKD